MIVGVTIVSDIVQFKDSEKFYIMHEGIKHRVASVINSQDVWQLLVRSWCVAEGQLTNACHGASKCLQCCVTAS